MKALRMGLLTALMALSLGAFAAPAMASEYDWTWREEPISEENNSEPQDIDLDGRIFFNGPWWPAQCDVDGEATLEVGGEGEITKFDLSNCEHLLPSCQGATTSTTVPWPIHAGWYENRYGLYPAMLIDDMSFTVRMPCGVTFTVKNADVTAYDPGWGDFGILNRMEFFGEAEEQTPYPWGVTGNLTVDPQDTVGVTQG